MVDFTSIWFAAGIVGVLAITLAGVFMDTRRFATLVRDLENAGFRVERPPGIFARGLDGRLDGRAVRVEQVKHGKNGPWSTRVATAHAGARDFELRVNPEGLGAKLAKAFGGQDAEVGDAEFDARFRVRTADEDRGTFVLSPTERSFLSGADLRRFDVTDGEARVELEGRVFDAERIVESARFLDGVARRVEATS